VKRGNIVIYPVYQGGLTDAADGMTAAATQAIREALKVLAARHAADPGKFALVGHSLGGVIAANIAASAATQGLPHPSALFVIEPGEGRRISRKSILGDYTKIPGDVLLLVLAGDRDQIVGSLTDAAFYSKNRDFALGNTPKQTFMGVWSDGTPVKPLVVTQPK
jgi:acetyl esterase/lipase